MALFKRKSEAKDARKQWGMYVDASGTLKNKIDEGDASILAKKEEAMLMMKLARNEEFDFHAFTLDDYKAYHQYLFGSLYEFAGTIRTVNMKKAERVLDGHSVKYTDVESIEREAMEIFGELLHYDVFRYQDDKEGQLWFLASHMADLWKVHMFREGNTRTTFSFMIAYANAYMQYQYDPSKLYGKLDMSIRDALVYANCEEEPNINYLLNYLRMMMV